MHIRVVDTLSQVARKALFLDVDFFQCFLTVQATGRCIKLTQEDQQEFMQLCEPRFAKRYAHASYWSNLASPAITHHHVLERELYYVKKLGFTHLVVHPGSAKGAGSIAQGIDAVARSLNKYMKKEPEIVFVVENTAHGGMSVGSDITDFAQLLQKIDQPERLAFCIDTAHAYVFGYDIANDVQQDAFIDLVATTIGLERVALMHINDTYEARASKMDRHATLFDGLIGQEALKRFVQHPRLRSIPLLPELPIIDEQQEVAIVAALKEWSR